MQSYSGMASEGETTDSADTECTSDVSSAYDYLRGFHMLSVKDSDSKNFTFMCKLCLPALNKTSQNVRLINF